MASLVYKQDVKKLREFKTDFEWFQKTYGEIKKYYDGRYVAIKNEEIIDNDRNAFRLINRLKRKYGKATASILVEPVTQHKYIYAL